MWLWHSDNMPLFTSRWFCQHARLIPFSSCKRCHLAGFAELQERCCSRSLSARSHKQSKPRAGLHRLLRHCHRTLCLRQLHSNRTAEFITHREETKSSSLVAKSYLRTWFSWAFRAESIRRFLFTSLKSRPAAPAVTGSESWYLINTEGNSVSHLIGDSCLRLRKCWKEILAPFVHYLSARFDFDASENNAMEGKKKYAYFFISFGKKSFDKKSEVLNHRFCFCNSNSHVNFIVDEW